MILLAGFFVLLLTARGIAGIWTDYLWFDSVDLTSVWSTLFFSRIVLAIAGSVVAFGVIWLNLVVADRLSPRFQAVDFGAEEELVERFQEWVQPRIRRVRLTVAAIFGVMIGLGAAAWWQDALLFINKVTFGVTDPIHDTDISFYVFRMPLYRDLLGWLLQLLAITIVLVAALHYLNGAIRVRQGRPPEISPGVKGHVSVRLAALALIKAGSYWLDRFDLLFSTSGAIFGASYTDVNARLPALSLLFGISIVAAGLLVWNIWRRGWTLPAVALGAWLFVSVVVGAIIPGIVQRFTVEPDELNKELPYAVNHVKFTREAYNIADVEVRPFAATEDLTGQDIALNRGTIDNIRLWDPSVLSDTYTELQEIRTYYQLDNVDVDRYVLGGDLTQVMVSTRELDQDDLPARGWVNERLVYTHGYGAVYSPGNAVEENGQPAFLVQDVPPVSSAPELQITQPRVYFGESYDSDWFLIVDTERPEVDFPTGEGESFATNAYDGRGGVEMGSLFRRLAFALRFGDLNTLIAPEITDQSRALMVRNIKDRVNKVAPFLRADNDPYIVLLDGRLVWVLDLYTVSDRYPYSVPANVARLADRAPLAAGPRWNYIRNSVKSIIDAYDGTMTLYIVDPGDPLIQAYNQIFPTLFTDGALIPDELRRHLRYPEDLFRMQSDIYSAYHMEPSVFLQEEDLWEIPGDPSTADPIELLRGQRFDASFDPMLPYYLLMQLPEEEDLSYLILQPFNPKDRPNMTAFMVAKSDPGEYGKIIDFRLPRGTLVNGPTQVSARINQDPEISSAFTLLGQQGSRIIQGNLLVVPIEESIVYFQPVYLKGEVNPLPEFKSVIVVYGEQIVLRDTLGGALAEIFGADLMPEAGPPPEDGEQPPPPSSQLPPEVVDLLEAADEAFGKADAALRSGDLAEYQRQVDIAQGLVQQALRRLEGALDGSSA
jgi:uncharacterized membrane protein (UPF0182 family)